MLHTLQNDVIKITVSDRGAELKSITALSDGTEYLFNGDPTWWKYSSPVLFPIVGKLVDNKYRAEGQEFELPSHGFGRTSDFEFVVGTADTLTFKLGFSDETLKIYPYKFALEISFTLVGNEVKVLWKIINIDDKAIYFSIGAHPAIRVPFVAGEIFEDYYLKFNAAEKAERIMLATNGNLSHEKIPTLDGTELNLNYPLFKDDALVFAGLKSDEVSVCSRKNSKSLTVRAKNFPYWGFWTPSKGGAPFVCLEPWQGHADYVDFAGEFKDKEGINKLATGETFAAEMAFVVNN